MKKNIDQNSNEGKLTDKLKNIFEQAQPKENKEALNINSNADSEIELERREVYAEHTTQNLLRYLLENENEDITPIYHPDSGFIYKTIVPLFEINIPHTKIAEFLDRLARLGILKKSFFESASTCPNCKSTILTLHYRCPKCKSHHLDKTSLTEHIPCGYIAEREQYVHNRCPKCGNNLETDQYRDMGRWYICKECGEKTEDAEFDIICRKCGKGFAIEEAKLIDIPKFSINIERKKEIRQSVVSLEYVNKLLIDLGFTTEMPGIAIGEKSRMSHHLSLIAKRVNAKNENTIAIDHAVAENEVPASPLILYLYKISEIKIDLPIFVAIPKLSESAKKIAQGHKILLIEGSINEDSIDDIKQAIINRLTEINEGPKIDTVECQETPSKGESDTKKSKPNYDEIEGKKPQPQLFDVIPTIHPEQQSSSIKRKLNFISTIRKNSKK